MNDDHTYDDDDNDEGDDEEYEYNKHDVGDGELSELEIETYISSCFHGTN